MPNVPGVWVAAFIIDDEIVPGLSMAGQSFNLAKTLRNLAVNAPYWVILYLPNVSFLDRKRYSKDLQALYYLAWVA